jgi:hypothetical protein
VCFCTYGLLLSTGFGRPVGLTVLCVDCVTQGSLRLAGGGGWGGVFENLLLSDAEFAHYFKYRVVYVYVCVIHVQIKHPQQLAIREIDTEWRW